MTSTGAVLINQSSNEYYNKKMFGANHILCGKVTKKTKNMLRNYSKLYNAHHHASMDNANCFVKTHAKVINFICMSTSQKTNSRMNIYVFLKANIYVF